MKDYDRKMREKWIYSEDERMQRKVDRELSKYKKCYSERNDKDEQMDNAFQKLLNLKAELEG